MSNDTIGNRLYDAVLFPLARIFVVVVGSTLWVYLAIHYRITGRPYYARSHSSSI